jgi:hypothetical protein
MHVSKEQEDEVLELRTLPKMLGWDWSALGLLAELSVRALRMEVQGNVDLRPISLILGRSQT